MWWTIFRGCVAGIIVVVVSELSQRFPRAGALLLTLPIVSILAFVMAWTKYHDTQAISRLARETLLLVPLGLPFFVPLAFAPRLGWSFWPAFVAGIALASTTIGLWLWLAPKQL